jgi:fused signal recognition particle receptor
MSGEKKGGFWQRLFGFDAGEEAKKEPPKREPERKEPPSGKPERKEPTKPKPVRKEPPERKRPPKQAEAAPPPAGPKEVPGERPPEERPAESRAKGTPHSPEDPGPKPKGPGGRPPKPKTKAPPPAGPATAPGATPPEDRPPGTREKGTPEEPDLPAKDDEGPSKALLQSPGPRRSWFAQLTQGLSRSSAALGDNLASVLTRRKLDDETLDELEDVLLKADLGVIMASRIRSRLASLRQEWGLSPEDLREVLAGEIAKVLEPVAKPLQLDTRARPHVILMVGVNGTGKTTTAAKLAYRFIGEGKSVMLAAADTFRAAAIDQLKVWGGRVGAEVVAKSVGADPAGVAFEALERAKAEDRDVLIIDTAGRLQNKSDLMAELAKIVRVVKKLDPAAPHSVVLVLDATTGQNAVAQVQTFQEIAGVTSLVVTKLDGTARGGILAAIAERFELPVNAIGIGEGVDDLQAFEARDFARAIAGLEVKDAKAA